MKFQGHRRVAVGDDHVVGVRAPSGVRELGAVDHVAEVARANDAFAGFDSLGPRLGVLAGKPPYPNDGALALVDHDQRHLKEDLQLVRDDGRTAVGEGLCAVTPLEQKALPLLRLREQCLQPLNLPRRDDRGELRRRVHAASSVAGSS